MSEGILAQMKRAIDEDVVVIETIEHYADRYPSTKRELSCQADAGAIRVRRTLAAQTAAASESDMRAVPIHVHSS